MPVVISFYQTTENEPDVSATFKEAADKDNENVDPNDPINYDKVYYYIVGRCSENW